MALANRHSISNSVSNSTIKPKWNIVFFCNDYVDIKNHFYKITIEAIKKDYVIDNVYIYTTTNLFNDNTDDNIIIIKVQHTSKSLILNILQHAILNKTNILYFQNDYGYLNKKPILHVINVKARIKYLSESKYLIVSDALIIPYSDDIVKFINYAITISKKIQSSDIYYVATICLTISSIKNNIKIHDLNNLPETKNFVSLSTKKIFHHVKESYVCQDLNKIQFYDNAEYLYYPYIDIDIRNIHISKMHTDALIFNTHGIAIQCNNSSIKSVYHLMYKRFKTSNNGLFIKKNYSKKLIPKILHYFWLSLEPDDSYINNWKKMLREPWKCMIWTDDAISELIRPNTSWYKFYSTETNCDKKLLIAYMAVLEKYGGVAIDSYVIPLKLFDDRFLMNKCVVGFSGDTISTRIMAALPVNELEESTDGQSRIKYHASLARKPYEMMHNMYRTDTGITIDTNADDLTIYNDIYQILLNGHNVTNYLLNNKNVVIYPEYYFNPNIELFTPHKNRNLLNLSFCMYSNLNLWNNVSVPIEINKCEIRQPERILKITTEGIIARLTENPRDRLLNIRS